MNGLETEKQSFGKQAFITCPPFDFVTIVWKDSFTNIFLRIKAYYLINSFVNIVGHMFIALILKNVRLCFLPPYSLELNPVEHIWDELKGKEFHNKVFSSLDALEDHLMYELRKLESAPEVIRSIVSWPWIINSLII